MFGLQVLDIGLGLMFLYLVLSLTCTAATELLAGVLRLRAKTLSEGISNLLREPAMKDKMLKHPLIRDLQRDGKEPSYIPARTFALSLLNILSEGEGLAGLKGLRAKINNLPENSDLRVSLMVLMDEAGNDLKVFQNNVEAWYNDTMDRVTDWYKSKAQVITVVIALTIAILANADTIQWTKSLSNDPALREALVAQVQVYAKQDYSTMAASKVGVSPIGAVLGNDSLLDKTPATIETVTGSPKNIQDNIAQLKTLGVPLGWESFPTGWAWIKKIVGLLLTTLAMSLGAPFWFDMLKKVVNIRSSVQPATSPEEKNKS